MSRLPGRLDGPLPAPGSGRPVAGRRFRRGLRSFTVIFALLLLADVAVVGHLIFSDLSKRVINEARIRTRQEAEQLAAQLPPASEVATPVDLYRVVQTTTTFARYLDRLLQNYTIIQRVDIINARGERVFTRARRADIQRSPGEPAPEGELIPAPDGELTPAPGGPLVRELPGPPEPDAPPTLPEQESGRLLLDRLGIPVPVVELGPRGPGDVDRFRRSRNVYNIRVPVSGGEGFVQVQMSPDELQREIETLRRDLMVKILIGAGISLILIVVAYLFVVKLFNKTRRLESESQMADRLAYVGTLAAGLAHEIRNPLSAMKLNLQMLESGLPDGGGDGEARDLLKETQAEVDRLGGLVTEFLSYARPGRLELKPADLNEIAEETVNFLKADAEQRRVRTELDLRPDLPIVDLDSKQIRQAILNVVRNAVAAVEGNGGGTVRVASAVNSTGEVRLTVEDDGPGIPPDRLPHIFQVFYSSKPGGTGLGLPIAQRVVEGHGGRIEVESAPGSGTRFTLTFPVSPRGGARAAS